MYLDQCTNAYAALLSLMKEKMDYQTAHAMVLLKRKLQPHVEFFVKQERRLMDEYAEKDEKGNVVLTERGTFRFRNPEQAGEYAKRRSELCMVPLREKIKRITLPVPEQITPDQLEALEPFFQFGPQEAGRK